MTWRVIWNLGDKERCMDFTQIIYAEIFENDMKKQCEDVKLITI